MRLGARIFRFNNYSSRITPKAMELPDILRGNPLKIVKEILDEHPEKLNFRDFSKRNQKIIRNVPVDGSLFVHGMSNKIWRAQVTIDPVFCIISEDYRGIRGAGISYSSNLERVHLPLLERMMEKGGNLSFALIGGRNIENYDSVKAGLEPRIRTGLDDIKLEDNENFLEILFDPQNSKTLIIERKNNKDFVKLRLLQINNKLALK